MELYDKFHVAALRDVSLAQMGNANINPWTEAKVNTKNPDRGPLLIIEGEKDHTVPWAIADAAYDRQKRNPGVTEIVEDPEPRPLPHDRPRLARGRRDGAHLRQAVRVEAWVRQTDGPQSARPSVFCQLSPRRPLLMRGAMTAKYTSGLVPRPLAVLGLIAGPVLLVGNVGVLFDLWEPTGAGRLSL